MRTNLRVLFVGDSWKGSTARTFREALAGHPSVMVEEIDSDHYLPLCRSLAMRAANRLLRQLQSRELTRAIDVKLKNWRPDVLVIFKGCGITQRWLAQTKAPDLLVVNLFPDCSPHAHGRTLRAAMGEYDLVISTKCFHPAGWQSIYGYANRCVYVPKGYDPAVHYWPEAPTGHDLDVVMSATWRPQYHTLMESFADETRDLSLRVAIAGDGWLSNRRRLPLSWRLLPAVTGRAYGEFLRSGRIAIAPVHRDLVVDGVRQPGDEDTTRTYELAAAHCFYVHRRTEYVRTMFDEFSEVPLWDDATELAMLVRRFLPLDRERHAMAAAAHARAVPRYSSSNRVIELIRHLREALSARKASRGEFT